MANAVLEMWAWYGTLSGPLTSTTISSAVCETPTVTSARAPAPPASPRAIAAARTRGAARGARRRTLGNGRGPVKTLTSMKRRYDVSGVNNMRLCASNRDSNENAQNSLRIAARSRTWRSSVRTRASESPPGPPICAELDRFCAKRLYSSTVEQQEGGLMRWLAGAVAIALGVAAAPAMADTPAVTTYTGTDENFPNPERGF